MGERRAVHFVDQALGNWQTYKRTDPALAEAVADALDEIQLESARAREVAVAGYGAPVWRMTIRLPGGSHDYWLIWVPPQTEDSPITVVHLGPHLT